MFTAGIFCICALVLLIMFSTWSAIKFPSWRLPQALFESVAVLCVALVLVLPALKSVPPAAFVRGTNRSLATDCDLQWSITPGKRKLQPIQPMQFDNPNMPKRLFRRMVHPEPLDEIPFMR
jgi:hypothetical protein